MENVVSQGNRSEDEVKTVKVAGNIDHNRGKGTKRKDENSSVSSIMLGFDGEQKRRYLSQRVAFVVFSKVHHDFNLKLNTPFLAFEIYTRID